MRVQIIKCEMPSRWYADKIGETFLVSGQDEKHYFINYEDSDAVRSLLLKTDTVIIDESDVYRDTKEHIAVVQRYLHSFMTILALRGADHDKSKLVDPERTLFNIWVPRLAEMEYGSDEYKEALEQMGPALDHHYRHNRHHPEYFSQGILGMNLFDLLEMLADWKAAGERSKDGDFDKSLAIGKERFNIPEPLNRIIRNTAIDLGWLGEE